MSVMLKRLNQQVIFFVGATSDVGLATLRMAIDQGAKVFMVGSDERSLQKIQDEMRRRDLPTAYAVAELSEVDQLQVAADQCLATFGTIDTWINLSASIGHGEAARQKFDDNFWSLVYGSRMALTFLKDTGGSLVNIANLHHDEVATDTSIHKAFEYAVRGFTEELRDQVKSDKAPVSISFVSLSHESRNESPEYVPQLILTCASTLKKDLKIGAKNLVGRFAERIQNIKLARVPKVSTSKPSLITGLTTFIKRKRGNDSGTSDTLS